jgi:hypothetical protein
VHRGSNNRKRRLLRSVESVGSGFEARRHPSSLRITAKYRMFYEVVGVDCR